MNKFRRYFLFILITPIFYLIALWISLLPHEYAHSITAWLLGFKANPFAIDYGTFTWENILLVSQVDEHVNYYLIDMLGHRNQIGLVAFAGPGIATLGLYLISLFLLKWQKVKDHPYLFYFICWINMINLSELISYIYLRSFSAHGDIRNIVYSWKISPWLIFIVGGGLLLLALWYFFTNTLIEVYKRMHLNDNYMKVFFLVVSSFLFFGISGIRMLLEPYGQIASMLGMVCFIIMLALIIICWPTNQWVKMRLKHIR